MDKMTREEQKQIWETAHDQIMKIGGAVCSSKSLRKYFQTKCESHTNKSYADLADIYGQLVSMGLYYARRNSLKPGGYFYTSSKKIADELCLSVRRVRVMVNKLVEYGLIEKKLTIGGSNKYRVVPEKFVELTKNIKFEYRTSKDNYSEEYGENRDEQSGEEMEVEE